MIYLVSRQEQLFESNLYTRLSEEDSVKLVESFDRIQLDTETLGRDAHLVPILTLQIGNDKADARIVVDVTTVDITIYKHALESKLCIGHNLKFDIQFLFKHGIILLNVFDTMVIEQLLHLGYDNKFFRYNLHDVGARYIPGLDLDKSVRGEIIWRGLDDKTIMYAANDVVYLERIMELEIEACKKAACIQGMYLENAFVPVIAYLEWCGIRLDVDKWKVKMKRDLAAELEAEEALNQWIIVQSEKDSFYKQYIDAQLDLFNPLPKITINWSSNKQLIPLFQHIGFNTKTRDKETGEIKDSITEKVLATQKHVNPEFYRLFFGKGDPEDDDFYMGFQGASKVVSTYGQTYINAINPYTGRIHTNFKQLGCASGRMACGNKQKNTDLSRINHCEAGYPQLQNLPHDAFTRSCFISNEGNFMTSCDYSALESRLGADIYNDKAMIDEFLYGSGDMHSLCAKMVFVKELEGIDVKDVKKKRPDLRSKVKSVEFAKQFGGGPSAISGTLGCSRAEAKVFANAYDEGFKGVTAFKKLNSARTKKNGYVLMCPITGHKMYWEDHWKWKQRQELDPIEFAMLSKKEQDEHQKAAAYWERMSLNAPTQGSGIIILKYAMVHFFKWIIKQGLFNKVLICDLVHDKLSLVVGKVC